MHKFYIVATWLVSVIGMLATGATVSAISIFSGDNDEQQHVTHHLESHMALVNSAYLDSISEHYRELVEEIANAAFLEKKASESDNALAPCALLTNVILSAQVFNLEWRIVREKQFPAPLAGTNILGMYDDVIAAGKFFDQPVEIKADMLARMHIYWSGGFDVGLNSFIHNLTQKQCLTHLLATDLESLADIFFGSDTISTPYVSMHYAPVAIHCSTYTRRELDQYLDELMDPVSIELAADATTSPVMPCSLLKAYMSAASINNLFETMRANELLVPPADMRFIGEYRELLQDGRISAADPVAAARVIAVYFANRIMHYDRLINDLIKPLNQRECLDEFINPGPVYDQLGH